MNTLDLKEQLINKSFDHVYYFTGDEWKIMNEYIHQIALIGNYDIEYVDTVRDIANDIKHQSIIAKPKCFIIRDDKEYLSNEKLWSKITELNKSNIVIFIISNVDKRSKFYKQFKGNIVEFNKLDEQSLTNYLSTRISLNIANMHTLINVCENDYGRLLLEIDKIKNYGGDCNDAFTHLLHNGSIYVPPKDAVFDLVDAILDRDARRSYQLYQDCKEVGEANLVILLNLFNNTKALYQVQSYVGEDVAKATGLSQGAIYGCKKHLYKYSTEDLAYMMKLVQSIELGIKQGKITDELSIDYLLANIF